MIVEVILKERKLIVKPETKFEENVLDKLLYNVDEEDIRISYGDNIVIQTPAKEEGE